MSDAIRPPTEGPTAVPDNSPHIEKVVRLMREEFGAPGEGCSFQCRRIGERRLVVELLWDSLRKRRIGAAYLVEDEEATLLARDRRDAIEVRLRGDIRAAAAANLVDLLVDALAQGRRRFIFDLGETSWIGSDAQGALESLVRSLRREGEPFWLEMRGARSWPRLLETLGQEGENWTAGKKRGGRA